MKQQIKIKTTIHESCSGSGTRVCLYWNVGPRNLMAALAALPEHRQSMTDSYGNVGHCGSWIEVSGVEMLSSEINDYEFDTDKTNFTGDYNCSETSKTQWCRNYIGRLLSGELERDRAENIKFHQAMAAAYNAGESAAQENNKPPVYDDFMLEVEAERGFDEMNDRLNWNEVFEGVEL